MSYKLRIRSRDMTNNNWILFPNEFKEGPRALELATKVAATYFEGNVPAGHIEVVIEQKCLEKIKIKKEYRGNRYAWKEVKQHTTSREVNPWAVYDKKTKQIITS